MAKPDLVGIVVQDMETALEFYRLLGLDIPPDAGTQVHVEITLENGFRIAWDTIELMESIHPAWSEPIGHRMVLAFKCTSPAEVDELFERVKNAPLLILDDYGEHSSTPWAQEKLYQLINYRYNARLPMVVTMCCSLDELDESERRVSSRLLDLRLSTVYYISAPDYRADHTQKGRTRPAPRYGRRG